MKLLVKNICMVLSILFSINTHAQAPSKFFQRFGGNGYDIGYDVKQTLDSGYIVAGSTSSFGSGNTDMYLVKLDKMGQIKFQKTFGNFNNENAKSVVQLSDSGYVLLGYTNSIGFGGYDMYLVKTDKNGNFIWQKNYGGFDWDFGNSIQQTTDGGFIIAGSTNSFGRGATDGYVIKIDASGNITWSKTFGGINDDEFKSVIQTIDGGYALTGFTKSYNDVANGDLWVFKINALGDSTWCKFYGGANEDFGNCILEHPSGNFYVSGASESFGVGLLDGLALKLDNLGNQLFIVYDGTSTFNEVFSSIAISKRNNQFITVIEKENFPGYNLQFKLFEFTLNLVYLGSTDYGSTFDDEVFTIIPTTDKGYACVGYTKGYGAILDDVYLVKLDSNLMGGNHSIVGVNELERSEFFYDIFPIPTEKNIKICLNNKNKINVIKMFDVVGNEILISNNYIKQNDNYIEIDLSNFLNGIYFLKINSVIKKICVQHE